MRRLVRNHHLVCSMVADPVGKSMNRRSASCDSTTVRRRTRGMTDNGAINAPAGVDGLAVVAGVTVLIVHRSRGCPPRSAKDMDMDYPSVLIRSDGDMIDASDMDVSVEYDGSRASLRRWYDTDKQQGVACGRCLGLLRGHDFLALSWYSRWSGWLRDGQRPDWGPPGPNSCLISDSRCLCWPMSARPPGEGAPGGASDLRGCPRGDRAPSSRLLSGQARSLGTCGDW